MKPGSLIDTARRLCQGRSKPTQADLKRAVSTAYYALFHALCLNAADCLIGGRKAQRSEPAWLQVYRAIDHKPSKAACKHQKIRAFPKDVEDFATVFADLQEERHRADYDPTSRFLRSEVNLMISRADDALRAFQNVPLKHRRAFAAWIALKTR